MAEKGAIGECPYPAHNINHVGVGGAGDFCLLTALTTILTTPIESGRDRWCHALAHRVHRSIQRFIGLRILLPKLEEVASVDFFHCTLTGCYSY